MTKACLWGIAILLTCAVPVHAAEPVTLDNVVAPEPNRADEPFAKKFSMDQALHFLDSAALDRMWTVQRETGDWKWPTRCRWPPMESDEHYGVTLAAIGTGAAPDNYAKTSAAQVGLAKIRTFLKNNPAPDLHHKAMVLWAS